jgi:hypothetical protein
LSFLLAQLKKKEKERGKEADLIGIRKGAGVGPERLERVGPY